MSRKRDRIVERATSTFMARGFDGVRLDDIASDVGVGKIAIYRHFANKDDLFAQCVLEGVRAAGASLEPILRDDAPLEEVLVRYAENHAAEMLKPVAGGRPFYEMAAIIVGTSRSHPELAFACQVIFRQEYRSAVDRMASTDDRTEETGERGRRIHGGVLQPDGVFHDVDNNGPVACLAPSRSSR